MSTTTMTPAREPFAPSAPTNEADDSCWSRIYRLTVEQYDRMVEASILAPEDRVELIEGLLVTKMGRNRPHIVSGKKTLRVLQGIIPPGWHVAKEDPVLASDDSKPEPDIAIVRGREEDYLERDVSAGDLALLSEIAESSLHADQNQMKALYAASGIPFYWIINLVDRRLEVFSEPEGREYRKAEVFSGDQDVPVILDGAEAGRVRVADLLP